MVLARLADRALPPGQPLDLINVAFGEGAAAAPDRLTAIRGVEELASLSGRPLRLVEVDVTLEELKECRAQLTSLLQARAVQPPCNRRATAVQPPCNRRVAAV